MGIVNEEQRVRDWRKDQREAETLGDSVVDIYMVLRIQGSQYGLGSDCELSTSLVYGAYAWMMNQWACPAPILIFNCVMDGHPIVWNRTTHTHTHYIYAKQGCLSTIREITTVFLNPILLKWRYPDVVLCSLSLSLSLSLSCLALSDALGWWLRPCFTRLLL